MLFTWLMTENISLILMNQHVKRSELWFLHIQDLVDIKVFRSVLSGLGVITLSCISPYACYLSSCGVLWFLSVLFSLLFSFAPLVSVYWAQPCNLGASPVCFFLHTCTVRPSSQCFSSPSAPSLFLVFFHSLSSPVFILLAPPEALSLVSSISFPSYVQSLSSHLLCSCDPAVLFHWCSVLLACSSYSCDPD